MRTQHYLGTTPLFPVAQYVRALRPLLPPDAFAPARSRLALLPVHLAVIVAATLTIANGWIPWFGVPLLSVVIGTSFACLTFIAHEAMHGAIVRNRRVKHVISWFGFLPFVLSPRLWAAWHDRVHHARANQADDPDLYPDVAGYHASSRARFSIDQFSLGGRRWRGGLSLILGFTVQSAHQLILAEDRGFLDARERKLARAETALGIGVWLLVAGLVGFVSFLFVFVLPLLIANAIVMSYILTNHSLSPRVTINDPLVSSLTVTNPRWFELLTLNFGYHVEHHLFPAMSSRHAHKVRSLVQERWPGRYQSMPHAAALGRLHRTARVYKDATTLVDPTTGAEYPTLLPADCMRDEPARIPA
ncbi:MAG: fatty acid desaturase [Myxococcota bacterium]|nr:fatty acid desaturase [Myxococcota bacterium]